MDKKESFNCCKFIKAGSYICLGRTINYIDVISRIQIEEIIKEANPTLIFVEHDKRFVEDIANKNTTIINSITTPKLLLKKYVNMFPVTAHIECVALLIRAERLAK